MKIDVVAARDLAPELVARWIELQAADARFVSPFFRPEFTQAVAATRDDVFVGVMSEGGLVRGFLPFQRSGRKAAVPVGLGMSNYQGVIVEPGTIWNVREFVRGLGLTFLEFSHLICTQEELKPFHSHVWGSPVVDTAQGFASWIASRRAAGVSKMKQLPRKIRKLEREIGPIRFEPHVASDNVLHTLVQWKRAQYLRTGRCGSLIHDWAVEAIGNIANTQKDGFAGMLSALYAGDRLLAAHMGMRSRSVWHYWYPAFDREHAAHSPGQVLLWKMIEWGASNAIDWIDLGSGESQYKASFATRDIEVAEASVLVPSLSGLARVVRGRSVRLIHRTRLLDLALLARHSVYTAARRHHPPRDQTGRS